MISLSLDSINHKAEYKVEPSGRKDYCSFWTDFGVQYLVGFDEDNSSLVMTSYQLVIVNVNNKKSPLDPKVRDTIIAIVEDFFLENNEVILYICETGDGKQSFRDKLFERWVLHYHGTLPVSRYSATVMDEGIVNFATIILRNDHPNYQGVVRDFTETTTLLNSKPTK